MARSLTSGVLAQIKSTAVRPVFLVSAQFADQTLYAWTGIGTITWNGYNYLGVGSFLEISPISETNTVEAQGVTLTLSGVDPTWLNESLSQINHSGSCWIYLAFLDPTGAVVADPIPVYAGFIDQPQIEIDAEKASITLQVEHKIIDLNRSHGGRYTDCDQQERFPGDNSCKWVSYLADRNFVWK